MQGHIRLLAFPLFGRLSHADLFTLLGFDLLDTIHRWQFFRHRANGLDPFGDVNEMIEILSRAFSSR